ncbi:MAG: YdeI/OmpD-associated family protein [Cytophagaceae bacterium]|nr:YdeI/OmpD-associated family protein [Cytophagaceae bacterium]
MIRFTALIQKFARQGKKTGWTYIDVPLDIAEQLVPGNKKGFRVKGKLDNYAFEGMSLLPMGQGNFILTLNATVRKAIKKQKGDKLKVQMEVDKNEKKISSDFMECLADEPSALEFFKTLTRSHQHYFSNWIESAKTDTTKAKRIAQAVNALAMKFGYPEMIRMNQKKNLLK